MADQGDPDVWSLADLATPWCVHVVSTLGIADHIEAGYTGIEDLAGVAGCDAGPLRRVLRHLTTRGLFDEPEPGRFALNDAARELLDPGVKLGLNLDGFGGRMAYAWGSLLSAVRTGRPAYHEVFGKPFWDDIAAHPDIHAEFDAMMGPAGHGVPDPNILVEADWRSVGTVVDVGGGTGTLLAEILRAQPHVSGVLVDFPATVARASDTFRAAGVADRVTTAGQSFFEPLPTGGDVYILKSVLDDWPDPEATAILSRCAEAARPDGRVVVLSGVTPAPEPDPSLLMLVLVGGKERTLDEFRGLAAAAGLEVCAGGRQSSGRFVVECRPR